MTISVITATYNSAKTIASTLTSVASQDHPQVEHIIVDGVSIDDTLSIVKSFPHVSICVSEKDQGIYDAMNKGIGLSTGEIIGILNSDDFYADSGVLSSVAAVFKDSRVDAVYADLDYVDALETHRVLRHWHSGLYTEGSFKWGWMPPHPTFFVRKELYTRIGAFNLGMGTAADYELMLRFIHKHKINLSYIPRVLVKMRAGGASNASLVNRLNANKEDRRAWEVNGLQPFWFTLYLKPLRKLGQYIFK